MAISKAKKGEILEAARSILGKKSVVFVNFKGLTVTEANNLRAKLRAVASGYRVVKKTLLLRALGEHTILGTPPALSGEIGVAYGDDPIAPAREVYALSRGKDAHLAIAGGIFEGVYKDAAAMQSIATIPPLETLRAQLAFLLKSPLQKLAVGVHAVAAKKGA